MKGGNSMSTCKVNEHGAIYIENKTMEIFKMLLQKLQTMRRKNVMD